MGPPRASLPRTSHRPEHRRRNPGTAEEQAEADLENPSLGSESASVVMTEYADYQ
jgi:hypothetical protein